MKNLISFLSFIVICILAHTIMNVNIFWKLPETVRIILGCPPPVLLIDIALAVYAFSGFILKFSSIVQEKAYEFNIKDLGYCSAFFLFYSLSGGLASNIIPVVIIGTLFQLMNSLHYTLSNTKFHFGGEQRT